MGKQDSYRPSSENRREVLGAVLELVFHGTLTSPFRQFATKVCQDLYEAVLENLEPFRENKNDLLRIKEELSNLLSGRSSHGSRSMESECSLLPLIFVGRAASLLTQFDWPQPKNDYYESYTAISIARSGPQSFHEEDLAEIVKKLQRTPDYGQQFRGPSL
ncbi:MAG: hypothetical protein ACRDRX_08470 [Pseudonocardiaceae bacterium]